MGSVNLANERVGIVKINNKGETMRLVKYNSNKDVVAEFQDEHKGKVHTSWDMFEKGCVKNPYRPSVFGVGIIGNKYKSRIKGKITPEYRAWQNMLQRCFCNEAMAYKDVTCCNEWLYYENFYEWLHSQENFDKWYNGKRWAVDKDILIKGNKIYSPESCCLVPQSVNALFVRKESQRGDLPIGVSRLKKYYAADCHGDYIGLGNTPEEAFLIYKPFKENLIKQVAQEEYAKGNITKRCYDAMMSYEVEITD